jgi:multidomain signaling protein FimX
VAERVGPDVRIRDPSSPRVIHSVSPVAKSATAPVPMIVIAAREDDVDLINRNLRQAGHPVRCQWLQQIESLAETLEGTAPQLLWLFADELEIPIREVAKIRQQSTRMVPLIVVAQAVEEADITAAMLEGAQDLVSSSQLERLRAVAERELRSFRLEHALNETLKSAQQYKHQIKAFMAGSMDAIAHVQEGIVVEANAAWMELFGLTDTDALHGPLMDQFDVGTHAALKGALAACQRGKWDAGALKAAGILADGSTESLKLELESTLFEGEPAAKVTIRREPQAAQEPAALIETAVHTDPMTGLYHRRRFVEIISSRLESAPRGGVRALAFIRPDKFGDVEQEVGPLASEEILIQLAGILRDLAHPQDVCGRFGGTVFAMLLERGTVRDIEAWAENAVTTIADQIFEVERNSLALSCTIGLAEAGPSREQVETLVASAEKANQRGRQRGGNQVVFEETSDETTRVQRLDDVWVKQIKVALLENRFKLAHQPIISLAGEELTQYDTVVRMVDPQGDEVPATEFMRAAARNGLMKAIDRWVIGASVAFCRAQNPDRVFVKLSKDTILDDTFIEWLAKQVEGSGVPADRLCFQIAEEDVTQYLKQSRTLAELLKDAGHFFAVEHFGIGRDPDRVLSQMPMHFLKIDGSLMQSLATNPLLQERVRGYIKTAGRRKIRAIAERVEDANTMAVLFQLGAAYMQGHYVQEPEVVLG